MVVAEALANGVPVIASKGMPWSKLELEGYGLWLENDAQILASGIQQMSKMPLREVRQRGREWMRRDFSWEFVAKEMLKLYNKTATF
jgi:glycosyltransferase involved in cell wall biosynthesis